MVLPAAGKKNISKMVATKLRTAHITPENLISEAEAELKSQANGFLLKKQVQAIIYNTLWFHYWM